MWWTENELNKPADNAEQNVIITTLIIVHSKPSLHKKQLLIAS